MSSFNEPTLGNHNEATIQSYLEGIVEAICHVRQLSVEELTAIGRCIEFGNNHDSTLLTYHIKQLNVVSSLIGPIVSALSHPPMTLSYQPDPDTDASKLGSPSVWGRNNGVDSKADGFGGMSEQDKE
ncbi:hypothetical protein BU17DRAFT_64232 [Hysterangium stoloniferum]|nr:hypothetical protein BU17DRAFT_64232 [Hysterangium stoloniferum]